MKLFQKMKGKLGFTLAELLVVIALLAIVTAVAVPNTAAYVKRIKLTELDDSARSIYMAAQNRLDDLKALGTDMNFAGAEFTEGLTCFENAPSTLKYITYTPGSNDDFMKLSVVESQLDENYYLIEYDPETGIAYSAFYAEKSNYEDEAAFVSAYKALKRAEDREFGNRLAIGGTIGYYGATVAVNPIESDKLPKPTVKVINAEKLAVEITAPDGTYDRVHFTVSVCEKDDRAKQAVIIGEDDKCYLSPNGTTTIILDTLSTTEWFVTNKDMSYETLEKSFSSWVGADVTLGANIEVTVTFYDEKGISKSESSTVSTNSLFESVSGDSDSGYIANVSYGRHLQNLNNTNLTITGVNVTKDIDFNSEDDDYKGWKKYYYGGNYTFYAIKEAKAENITAVTGNNHSISYADITGAGLFEKLDGTNVEKLSLVNTTVTSSDNAGALAGTMVGGSVTNVEIYVKEDTTYNWKNEKYDWSDPEDDPHWNYAISGSQSVGGLVGEANGTTIKSSYASVKVMDGQNAGGLVGSTNGMTLNDVYSGGHTYKGSYDLDGGTTLINVKASQSAGGIIGNVTGEVKVIGTVYSTCSVQGGANSDTAFGKVSGNYINTSGAAYCYAAGYNYGSTGDKKKSAQYDNGVKTGDDAKADDVYAYRYDTSIGTKYPFRGIAVNSSTMSHRGDWVSDEPIPVFGFFYWEIHDGSPRVSVIYYNVTENKVVEDDNLCEDMDGEDDKSITKYGYGYFYTGSTAPKLDNDNEFIGDGKREKYNDFADAIEAALQTVIGTTEDITFEAYCNKGEKAVSNSSNNKLTLSVEDKSVTVTYNPDFYAMIEGTDNSKQLGKEQTGETALKKYAYKVRTVAQLQHVDSYLASGLYFMQAHDLKGGTITPIGKDEDNTFKGTYDGRSYRIIELTINGSGRQYVGIFGVTEDAVLKNIILFAPASENANSGSYILGNTAEAHYIGGIVGYAKVGPTTLSVSASLPVGYVSANVGAGLKVSSLGVSSGEAKVVNAYNSIYAKTAALGASTGAKVRALSKGSDGHVHHFPDYNGANGHSGTCTICGYHTYYDAHTLINGKCESCDYECSHSNKRMVQGDANGHYYYCDGCQSVVGDKERHTFNNVDPGNWGNCTVCGGWFQNNGCAVHTPGSEWKSNGNTHWHECTVCGSKTNEESHAFSSGKDNGNGTHTATCNVCKDTVTAGHSPQGKVTPYDKNQHNYTCACGAEVGEKHTESNWITDVKATADKDGHRYKECTVCKYVTLEETIPAGKDPNACPQCESSNTRYMGNQGNDIYHYMHCDNCGKDFEVEHVLIIYDAGARTDGGQPIAQIGEWDSGLGKYVTLEDVEKVLQTKILHEHHCEVCQKLVFFPLTLDQVRVEEDGAGDKFHRFFCIYCNGSVMLQYHKQHDCILCDGTYKTQDPEYKGRGVIENCAVAGYTLKDATTSGNTFVGGIAGKSDVPIRKCEAVVDIVCVKPASGEANYGGIAGESTHYISDCYTGGYLNMDTQKHTHNHVGLIVGEIGASTWVSDCYSYMKHTNFGSGNTDIEFNDADSAANVNRNPRTYVNKNDIDKNNRTDYNHEPKIYDVKVGTSSYEHYGYFK